jgi:hypothetical protein
MNGGRRGVYGGDVYNLFLFPPANPLWKDVLSLRLSLRLFVLVFGCIIYVAVVISIYFPS